MRGRRVTECLFNVNWKSGTIDNSRVTMDISQHIESGTIVVVITVPLARYNIIPWSAINSLYKFFVSYHVTSYNCILCVWMHLVGQRRPVCYPHQYIMCKYKKNQFLPSLTGVSLLENCAATGSIAYNLAVHSAIQVTILFLKKKKIKRLCNFSCEVSSDSVVIRDGPDISSSIIAIYCNTRNDGTVLSTGTSLHVTFTTDGLGQRQGFAAVYSFIKLSRDTKSETEDGSMIVDGVTSPITSHVISKGRCRSKCCQQFHKYKISLSNNEFLKWGGGEAVRKRYCISFVERRIKLTPVDFEQSTFSVDNP